MSRRSRRPAPLLGPVSLLLVLLGGCGATSTRSSLSAASGGTSSATAALAPRGPELGYLWDATRQNFYPLLGVAGAAHYGAALLPADTQYVRGAASGSSAAGTAWALLLTSSGTLELVTLPSTTPTVVSTRVPLDGTIAFSPSGAFAAVISASSGSVLLVSGLPGQAQVAGLVLPAGSLLSGVAVSDRGTLLAGWRVTGQSGVQVGTLSFSGANALANVTTWGGASFVPGAANGTGSSAAPTAPEQAVIADGTTGLLTRLSGIGGSAPTAAALSAGGKLQSPVAVAVTGDGNWAFVADSATQQLVRVDLSGSTAPLEIACACQPSRLLALPGNMMFEVSTDRAAQPAWLLDGHALAPRTFFVPALAPGAASTQSASIKPMGGSGR